MIREVLFTTNARVGQHGTLTGIRADPNTSNSGESYVIFGRAVFAPVVDVATATITITGGDDAFTLLGTAAHTGAGATLRYVQGGGNTLLFSDVDANGGGDFSTQINGLMTLDASDFIL
jgi:hypothetical protein